MSLSRQFKTNPEKVKAGVPFQVGLNDDGTRPTFTLARTHPSNTEFQKVNDRVFAADRQVWAITGKVNEELAASLSRKVFAEAAILDWANVLYEDVFGFPPEPEAALYVPYSVENAEKLLLNLPELYEILAGAAGDRSRYQDAEGDVKN